MPKIKIYTRSFSPELYKFSKGLYPAGVEAVRMTDRSADGYFYAMLRDTDCDIAINIDEDAYVCDPDAVMALAMRVYEEGWANAGACDCGPGCPRSHNPIVTNPFFNILNLKLIREKYQGPAQIREFDYQPDKAQMKEAFLQQVGWPLNGDFEKAREIHYRLTPFFKAAFIDGNPTSIKSAMNVKGLPAGGLRLPLVEVNDNAKKIIENALKECDL